MAKRNTMKGKTDKHGSNTAKPTKKAKTSKEINKAALDLLIDRAWEHYCNYMGTTEGGTDDDEEVGGGEVDELLEILDIFKDYNCRATSLREILPDGSEKNDMNVSKLTRVALLPVFLSVVHTILADELIAELSHAEESKEDDIDERNRLKEIQDHLLRALELFPDNAAAMSTTVNFVRMTTTAGTTSDCAKTTTTTQCFSLVDLSHCYVSAAETASRVHTTTLAAWMESSSSEEALKRTIDPQEQQCREWMEALLLNQVVGVDLIPPPPPSDDENEEEDEDDDVEVTPSAVEGTARFMAAMLYSMAGEHGLARHQLQQPFGVTHRIHPRVWQQVAADAAAVSKAPLKGAAASTADTVSPRPGLAFQPTTYASILPSALYHRLCQVFHPRATFWTESEYASRGYFSFYANVPDSVGASEATSKQPLHASNLMEDIICNHLLPLAQTQLQSATTDGDTATTSTKVVGYEWWVHTRSVAANLGHNLHFDTDEALLRQAGKVSHPIVSSVLYLTGGHGEKEEDGSSELTVARSGGATVVFDQTPESITNAEAAWCCLPVDNSFLMFPGNLLHGVLPCLGCPTQTEPAAAVTISTALSSDSANTTIKLMRALNDTATPRQSITDTTTHRLTLMVGFWTRRETDSIVDEREDEDEPELYGPCRPLPPAPQTAWVRELQQGYGETKDKAKVNGHDEPRAVVSSSCGVATPLTLIAPAWEEFTSTLSVEDNDNVGGMLEIPSAIDHKFFVVNAPECFVASLHDKQQFYDDEDDEGIDDDGDDDDC